MSITTFQSASRWSHYTSSNNCRSNLNRLMKIRINRSPTNKAGNTALGVGAPRAVTAPGFLNSMHRDHYPSRVKHQRRPGSFGACGTFGGRNSWHGRLARVAWYSTHFDPYPDQNNQERSEVFHLYNESRCSCFCFCLSTTTGRHEYMPHGRAARATLMQFSDPPASRSIHQRCQHYFAAAFTAARPLA
jgi:hypothetical protein